MTEKIKSAKANTMMRVNNVIWAKASDAENSKWRSAFGEMYANAFINMVLQSENAEFLTNEPLKSTKKVEKVEEISENSAVEPAKKRKFVAEKYNVREEEHN